jgi:creatinine amidohydrolase/Fe(II)-dependent formamide hydrolase-like protein
MEKVRYAEMLPHEIVLRREAFPAAFVGLGTLEWHSDHLAVGLDGLVAEALCERAAAQSGGFAFPTLWYGEPRVTRLMEATFDKDGQIKARMGFQAARYAPAYYGKSAEAQVEFYQALLYHTLIQMNTLEIRAVCLLGGHGPLSEFAAPVVERFNREFKDTQAFAGFHTAFAPESPGDQAGRDEPYFPAPLRAEGGLDDTGRREIWYRRTVGGDHAGKWETSYLWHLRPDCVDMSVYRGREAEPLVGVFGLDPRRTATMEIGRAGCAAIVDGLVRTARGLLERTGFPLGAPSA